MLGKAAYKPKGGGEEEGWMLEILAVEHKIKKQMEQLANVIIYNLALFLLFPK